MIKVTIVDDLLKVDIDTETSTVDIPSVTPSVNVVNVPDFTAKVVSPQYAVTLKQYGIQSQPTLFAAALEKQLAEIMAMSEQLAVLFEKELPNESLGISDTLTLAVTNALADVTSILENITFANSTTLEDNTALAEIFDRIFNATIDLVDNTAIVDSLVVDVSSALLDAITTAELDFTSLLYPTFDLQDSLVITESTLFGVSLDYLEQTTLLELPVLAITAVLVENSITTSEAVVITPNIIYTDTAVSNEGVAIYLQDYVQDYLPIDYIGQFYQY